MDGDLFAELKEDITREQLYKLIKKILPYFILCSILAVVVTSANVIYKNNKLKKLHQISEIYSRALADIERGNDKEGLKALDYVINQNINSFSHLAGIKKASLEIEKKQYEFALKSLDHIIDANNAKKIFLNVAKFYKLNLLLAHYPEQSKEISNLFYDLSRDDSAFKFNVLLLKANWLIDTNNNDKAKKILDEIEKNRNCPEKIKEHASILRNFIN